MPRKLIMTTLIGSALLVTGCANRPTSADLTQSILTAAQDDPTVILSNDEASCIAERLLETGLSDTTMAGLAENFDQPEVLSAEVDKVEPAVAEAAASCLTQG